MFILPYLYHKTNLGNIIVYQWNILTISGSKLWKEEDTMRIKEDILDPNGFILHSPPRQNGSVVYCELDESKLQMEDYYNWEELTKEDLVKEELFCWRKFYTFGPADDLQPHSHTQWLPTPNSQYLDPYPCYDLFQYLIHQHLMAI
jgi:hypothetical protein